MPGHHHYWEYRGSKRFVAGVWVSTYICKCGEALERCRGGRRADQQ